MYLYQEFFSIPLIKVNKIQRNISIVKGKFDFLKTTFLLFGRQALCFYGIMIKWSSLWEYVIRYTCNIKKKVKKCIPWIYYTHDIIRKIACIKILNYMGDSAFVYYARSVFISCSQWHQTLMWKQRLQRFWRKETLRRKEQGPWILMTFWGKDCFNISMKDVWYPHF